MYIFCNDNLCNREFCTTFVIEINAHYGNPVYLWKNSNR